MRPLRRCSLLLMRGNAFFPSCGLRGKSASGSVCISVRLVRCRARLMLYLDFEWGKDIVLNATIDFLFEMGLDIVSKVV